MADRRFPPPGTAEVTTNWFIARYNERGFAVGGICFFVAVFI
jgi:hypothetical protein